MACHVLQVGIAGCECAQYLGLLFQRGLQGNSVLPVTFGVINLVLPQMVGVNPQQHIHIEQTGHHQICAVFPKAGVIPLT